MRFRAKSQQLIVTFASFPPLFPFRCPRLPHKARGKLELVARPRAYKSGDRSASRWRGLRGLIAPALARDGMWNRYLHAANSKGKMMIIADLLSAELRCPTRHFALSFRGSLLREIIKDIEAETDKRFRYGSPLYKRYQDLARTSFTIS